MQSEQSQSAHLTEETQPVVWQPIMLIAHHRIECGRCAARAVIVVLEDEQRSADGTLEDFDYTAWCQDCWRQLGEEGE